MPRIVYVCLAASALAAAAVFVLPAGGEQAQPRFLTAEAPPASGVPFFAAPPTTTPAAPTTARAVRRPSTKPPATLKVAPRPSTNVAPQPGPCAGWEGLVAAHFPPSEVGRSCRVMLCESGGNPTARNSRSSASGLYQFLDGTWRSTTGRSDRAYQAAPDVQVAAAAKLHARSGWAPWSCRG